MTGGVIAEVRPTLLAAERAISYTIWELTLRELLGMMRVAPQHAVYVGDQPADAGAAEVVGTQFLGVTYGWGLDRGDLALHTVDNPAELATELLQMLCVQSCERERTYRDDGTRGATVVGFGNG